MQIRQVRWIDIAFVTLQIVAIVAILVDEGAIFRTIDKVVRGQDRRLARTEVGEYHARLLDAWIGGHPDPLVERAAGWLARLLEAPPATVVQPAVIDAA